MSNYYDVLGVWRDASPEEIELAAQAVARRRQDALEVGDAEAGARLQAVEHARCVLLNAETRERYDHQLLSGASPALKSGDSLYAAPRTSLTFPTNAGSSSWRLDACTLLAVPVVFSALVMFVVSLVRLGDFRSGFSMGDVIIVMLVPATLLAFPLGFAALVAGSRRVAAGRRLLRLQQKRADVDPVALARLREEAGNYELTLAAVWATRISLGFLVLLWLWFFVIFRIGWMFQF